MRFIKIFVGNDVPGLEKQINGWIAQHKTVAVDIRYSTSPYGKFSDTHCVCVVYEANAPIE
jgi:hypothetical protein